MTKEYYPQYHKSRRELELERAFYKLDPLVQNYIYAADGLVHAPPARKPAERQYLLDTMSSILKRDDHEALIAQLGVFLDKRNKRPK